MARPVSLHSQSSHISVQYLQYSKLSMIPSTIVRVVKWPAAAVIPAPIAYIKVAAVKKLVVGFLYVTCLALAWLHVRVPDVVRLSSLFCPSSFTGCAVQVGIVYFEQIRVFQAGRVPCIP